MVNLVVCEMNQKPALFRVRGVSPLKRGDMVLCQSAEGVIQFQQICITDSFTLIGDKVPDGLLEEVFCADEHLPEVVGKYILEMFLPLEGGFWDGHS